MAKTKNVKVDLELDMSQFEGELREAQFNLLVTNVLQLHRQVTDLFERVEELERVEEMLLRERVEECDC